MNRAALGIGVGAALIWVSSRLSWLTVTAEDDKAGTQVVNVVGATWSTESMAVALVLAAACIASLTLSPWAKRVVSAIAAVAVVLVSYAPIMLLTTGGDAARAHALLVAEEELNSWAQVLTLELNVPAILLEVLGCAVALVSAVLVVVRPAGAGAGKSRYERKAARDGRIMADLETDPESGRVLWDAIDADIDPTDLRE